MDIIIKNNCCIHSTRLIQKEFHNPEVSRRPFLQKRKKENVRNVPKNQKQNNKKQIILTCPKCHQFQSPRSCSYKKERKRTLETFPKIKNKIIKSKQHLSTRNVTNFEVQEAVPTKKKERKR